MAAIQASEVDTVPCQALHFLENLVFCPVEGRKKELLARPFLVKNDGFESMGNDGGYTDTRNGRCSLPSSSCVGEVGLLTIGMVEEATALISVTVLGIFHCKFIVFTFICSCSLTMISTHSFASNILSDHFLKHCCLNQFSHSHADKKQVLQWHQLELYNIHLPYNIYCK